MRDNLIGDWLLFEDIFETIRYLSVACHFLVACYATLHPALSVRPSVCPSVRPSHFTFFVFFCGLWPHCSCPSDQVTSNTAPAHPHATGVAVYPALFFDPGFVSGRRAEASQMGRQLIGSYRSSAFPSRHSHQQGRQQPNVGGV